MVKEVEVELKNWKYLTLQLKVKKVFFFSIKRGKRNKDAAVLTYMDV